MGIFGLFNTQETVAQTSSIEFQFDYVGNQRGYLKQLALETVIGYVARSFASSKFIYTKDRKVQKDSTYYNLNVRPNTDQSAYEFWYDFIYRLYYNGEVLVIFSDDNQMLIADSFQRTQYAVFPDTFSSVTVKDFTYNRTFSMDDVIYLKYGNARLSTFMDGMFSDYTDLFNRMIESQKLSNQYRAKVNIDANLNQTDEQRTRTQSTIDKMFNTIRTRAIAFLPISKGFDFDEINSGVTGSSSSAVEGLTSLKNSLIDEVCDIIGVPQGLVHGQLSDVDSLIKAFVKFCINPLNKMVEDELNAKIIGMDDFLNGERIKVSGIKVRDLIENATNVDKIISGGILTRNEIREEYDIEISDNPELDEFLVTKNYGLASDVSQTNTNGG